MHISELGRDRRKMRQSRPKSSFASSALLGKLGNFGAEAVRRRPQLKFVHFLGTPKPSQISMNARIYNCIKSKRPQVNYNKIIEVYLSFPCILNI